MKQLPIALSMLLLITAGSVIDSREALADMGTYWGNSSGKVWTNGAGSCWQGAKGTTDENCGGVMMEKMEEAPMAAAPNLDDDGDGVPNSEDICWTTPAGDTVDLYGCTISQDPVVTLQGVHFATDSSALTSEAKSILDSAVGAINASSSSLIDIEGHTDSRGSDSHNEALSERRAQSVADYLASQGVSASSLNPIGMGEGSPVASNDTTDGRRLNRRVDVTIR